MSKYSVNGAPVAGAESLYKGAHITFMPVLSLDIPRGLPRMFAGADIRQCFIALWLMMAGFVLLAGGTVAVHAAPVPQPARSQAVRASEPYLLAADDVVSVTVLRHPEMSIEQVMVSPAGKIQVPVAGEITVAGKTLQQVEAQIVQRLKNTLRRPQVTVGLRQARPRRIFVLGAVKAPGVYEVKPGWRVSEAVAVAGGFTARPELIEGTLNRASGPAITLKPTALIANSNSAENLVLAAGDLLRFSERITTIQVNFVGQVQKSGGLNLPVGTGIVEALAAAGGPLPKAALRATTVRRADGTQTTVDLYDTIVLGKEGPDFVLREGDLITLPESRARVTLIGAIQKPGSYDIEEGKGLLLSEALALAGGVTPKAALTRAILKRANGNLLMLNLYKLQQVGYREGNVALGDGDVLTVPESRGITILGAVTHPGTFYVEEGREPRMLDVLALAGGLTIKPDTARINIARTNPAVVDAETVSATAVGTSSKTVTPKGQESRRPGKTSPGASEPGTSEPGTSVDPVTLLELRNPEQNERVYDGDLITVSAIKSPTVFISGEVQTPGAYELKEGDSVPELITRAGGSTAMAMLSQVTVTDREGITQTVNVATALRDGGEMLDFPLEEGDFVVVPRNRARVFVMQAVNRPGYYPIHEGETMTVGEAISMAGGPKDRAKLKEVAILRQTPSGVQRQVFALDKEYNGRLAINQVLQSGDVVYVPEGKQSRSVWETITRSIGGLGVLGALF